MSLRHVHNGIDYGPDARHLFTKGQRVKLSARGLQFFNYPVNRRWVRAYGYDTAVRGEVVGAMKSWPSAVWVILSGTKTPQALHAELLEAA